MKKIFLFLLITITGISAFAQINVYSNNNVGIGSAATSANSSLSINTTGTSSYAVAVSPVSTNVGGIYYSCGTQSSTGTNWGIVSSQSNTGNSSILRSVYSVAYSSTPQTSGQAYAIQGVAGNSSNGYNVGVFGALQGSNTGAAVYGQVGSGFLANISGMYAGYFYGNVYITGSIWAQSGTITGSDQKLKKNIIALDSTDKIFNLSPVRYNLKSPGELTSALTKCDTCKTSRTAMPDPDYVKKQHYGFLAQDIQKVYPDLVYMAGDSTLGVDYQGFIPIIVDQLKKMKKSLDEKDTQIQALQLQIQQIKGNGQKGKP